MRAQALRHFCVVSQFGVSFKAENCVPGRTEQVVVFDFVRVHPDAADFFTLLEDGHAQTLTPELAGCDQASSSSPNHSLQNSQKILQDVVACDCEMAT